MPIRPRALPDSEAIALSALAFVAGDDDRLASFMALTGLSPEDLRRLPRRPEGLAALLDHLLADEPLLLQFCTESGLAPDGVIAARNTLPGAPLET